MSWTENLDFDLAWQRIQHDFDDDPYPDLLHYKNYQGHLEEIEAATKAQLSDGGRDKYRPYPFRSLDMPKANFTLRPVGAMHFRDRLLYQAICDFLAPRFTPESAVYSYRLAASDSAWMFRPGVSQWKEFQATIRDSCGQHQYMVETDLTAYFEHIDHIRLVRRLDDMFPDVEKPVMRPLKQTLQTLLRGWSNGHAFGIPQVCYPSSFFGNIYLDEFDKSLLRKGYPYLRYVDDIRVFADSLPAARTALAEIVQTLRRMGLYVSSAKTNLLPTTKVVAEMDQESATMERIDIAFDSRKRSAIEVVIPELEALFRASIGGEAGFRDRHFRFCIYRYRRMKAFGIGGDIHQPIVEAVLSGMYERPNASDVMALYLSLFPGVTDIAECILSFLESEYCVYPWQQMHLLEVLIRTVSPTETKLAERCRRYARKARSTGFTSACPREGYDSVGQAR